MQPVRLLLVWLGGVAALASFLALVQDRTKIEERRSSRARARVASPPRRNRLAAYYRVSLN